MEQPWYALVDMPPPYSIHVWVLWEGRRFKAVRGRHPQTGGDVWGAIKAGGRVEPIKAINGQAAPRLWQPVAPEKWAGKLPPAVSPMISDRVISELLRFDALEHVTSEEMAAEMEEGRKAARATSESHGFHVEHLGTPWWYDLSRIKYEQPGEVTLKNCEGRLLRAVTFSGAGKHRGFPQPPTARVLAEMAAAVSQSEDDADARLRLRMLPSDRSDILVALDWFVRLNPPEFWAHRRKLWDFNRPQKVLVARTVVPAPSFGDIAAEYGIDGGHNGAKRLYDKTLSKCLAAANGRQVHDRPVVDQMAALRERNRAFRRGA